MCYEATSVGLPQSIGIGKGTVSLEDFDHCELIIAMGHNPGTNHPRMMGTLWEVSRRGVPIIVFNPLRERALERFADPQDPIEMATLGATRIASTYYQPKVGADAAVLKGVMKALIEMDDARHDVLDHGFIAEHTNGFEAFAADLRATAWPSIETVSGFSRAQLGEVAAAYAKSNATIITYGMGITQRSRGTDNVQQIANLLLLKGNCNRAQASARCAVTQRAGQPHCRHHRSPTSRCSGISAPSASSRRAASRPRRGRGDGGDRRRPIEGDLPRRLNFAIAARSSAAPPPCASSISPCIGTKLNRSHLLVGKQSILLPVLGRTEQDIRQRAAGRHCRRFNVDGARLAQQAQPGVEHLRSDRPSWPAWRGDPAVEQGAWTS